MLKKHIPLLQQQGFSVGVWFWAFRVEGENSFTHITAPDKKISAAQVCPSDKAFIEFALEGNVVTLKEIPPYASVGFCVSKKKKPC